MNLSEHRYGVSLEWTGNRGSGTSSYRGYGRDHVIRAPGLPDLAGTAASTLLHFVLGHATDEQTHLQAGSAGAIPDGPRPTSDFALGLAIVIDGIRALVGARTGSS